MTARTRRQRDIANRICFCKEGKDDEIITCQGVSGCPGNGSFHKSCLQNEEITENYLCASCREQQASQRSDETEIFEQQLMQDDYTGVDEIPRGGELQDLPSYKREVEKIFSHHYINRKYKSGENLTKKLHFKVKWSGYNIVEHEKSENLLHPGINSTRALKEYCQNLPLRTIKTLLQRHPEFAEFLSE